MLLAGVVLAEGAAARNQLTRIQFQREQRFLDGSFVTLGCCFVIEFRALL